VDLQDLTSISFGYVFFFIGRNTIVNGVNSSNLTVNESFNFKKCTSDVHIETSTVIFTSKFNKTVLWTVEDTNTLYSNELEVEYV
jgi:phosphoribosylformylglycinamidine (FGAM) synthase-like amidotransferase family enzyme